MFNFFLFNNFFRIFIDVLLRIFIEVGLAYFFFRSVFFNVNRGKLFYFLYIIRFMLL